MRLNAKVAQKVLGGNRTDWMEGQKGALFRQAVGLHSENESFALT